MDPRIRVLAKNLVNYSTAVAPGEKVLIEVFDSALPLAKALVEETYRADGIPFVSYKSSQLLRAAAGSFSAATKTDWRLGGAENESHGCLYRHPGRR